MDLTELLMILQNYMIANSRILVIDVNLYGNLLDPNLMRAISTTGTVNLTVSLE